MRLMRTWDGRETEALLRPDPATRSPDGARDMPAFASHQQDGRSMAGRVSGGITSQA